VEILVAKKEDSDDIIKLVSEIWSEHGFTLLLEIEERHLLEPGKEFRESGGEFWVVKKEGVLVATCGFRVVDAVAEMKTLYVRKPFRQTGIGTRLSELAIETARLRGIKVMELWSDTRFHDAHRMYERLGFFRFGERDLNDHNQTREYGYRREI
jgi:GNAT superfamily N-acetyltransferase